MAKLQSSEPCIQAWSGLLQPLLRQLANSHRGIWLEFSLNNKIFCAALRCEYTSVFPIMMLHDDSDEAALLSLLAKRDDAVG